MVKRRTFLKSAGAAGIVGGLAGCIGGGGTGDGGNNNSSNNNNNNNNNNDGGQPYQDGQIKFLMSPTEPQDQMTAQYEPIGLRLNNYVDAVDNVDLQYARNYAATLESLSAGNADLAETGPFAAALGVNADKAEVLLQRYGYGSWTYKSVIVTREDTDISSLSDLEGRDIVFADPLSASGSLFPLAMLQEAGLSIPDQPGSPSGADFNPTWTSHSTAKETLLNEQADAAGVGYFIVVDRESESREYVEGVEELAIREGIPRAPIMVAPGLSDDEKSTLQSAFTEAPDDIYLGADGEPDTDDDLWFTDVRPADVDTYQPVIDVANQLGYGEEIFEN